MSHNIDIKKTVDRIIDDNCTDCQRKCGLCEMALCEDIIWEIGIFFIHCAEMQEKEENQ